MTALHFASFVVALAACGTSTDGSTPPPPGGASPDAAVGDDDSEGGTTPGDAGGGSEASDPDVGPTLPVVPASGPIPAGRYVIHNVGSTKCLDVAAKDAGALFVQNACASTPTQTFDVTPYAGKYLRVIDVGSGLGFDIKDKSTTAGTAIQQWTFYGNANQEVAAEPHNGDGTFTMRLRSSGLLVSVAGASTADGAGIEQASAADGAHQRWTFEPVAPLPAPGFADVSGINIIDGWGRYLLLRGVNLGNWLEPEGYMWQFDGSRGDRPRRIEARVSDLLGDSAAKTFWKAWRDNYTTEEDIARIAELGFNSIRLPMNARLLMPEGQDAFDEDEFRHISDAIAWSSKHGVYVILDMHCAPGGQTGANIDDDENDQPALYMDTAQEDRLVKIWTELAKRYVKEPWLLGYDLLNEPIAPQHSQYNDKLFPIYKRTTASIRTVDPNHIVILEGAQWANNWGSLGAPFDDKLVYSFHKYWNDNNTGAIQTYLDSRAKWNKPVWVGESGENDDGWYAASFSLLEANGIGWAFWPWKKIDGGNDPYDAPRPANWGAIQGFVSDASNKPSAATAQAAFDALLSGIPFKKSQYNEHVVCSLVPCDK